LPLLLLLLLLLLLPCQMGDGSGLQISCCFSVYGCYKHST
jgi:hypothetical protein